MVEFTVAASPKLSCAFLWCLLCTGVKYWCVLNVAERWLYGLAEKLIISHLVL